MRGQRMEKARVAWRASPDNPLISFDFEKQSGLFHSRRFALSDTCRIALAGTWCAPGIREGDGAGWVALTVARLGDEPPHPGPRVDASRRQTAAGAGRECLASVVRRSLMVSLSNHEAKSDPRAAGASHRTGGREVARIT